MSLTFIVGFLIGDEFVNYDVYGNEMQFNWNFAFSVWVCGTILSFLMFGLAKIIELLDEINRK